MVSACWERWHHANVVSLSVCVCVRCVRPDGLHVPAEKDVMDVWVDGAIVESKGEFCDDGTETIFKVGGKEAYIHTVSPAAAARLALRMRVVRDGTLSKPANKPSTVRVGSGNSVHRNLLNLVESLCWCVVCVCVCACVLGGVGWLTLTRARIFPGGFPLVFVFIYNGAVLGARRQRA